MEKLSNQTIKHILKDINTDLKEMKKSFHVELTEIKGFASSTNERVRDLEMWRNRVVGALAVITMLLIPIILQYVSKLTIAYFK